MPFWKREKMSTMICIHQKRETKIDAKSHAGLEMRVDFLGEGVFTFQLVDMVAKG